MTRFLGTPLRGVAFANAGDEAISVRVNSDTVARVRIDAGGRLTWSSGSATGDTVLYRDAADLLKTDDVFQAAGGLVTLTTDGAPTASIADGAIAIDTTNNVFYFRSNSTWQQVVGGGGGAEALDDLSDVEITSQANGQFLIYNGSSWVNGTLPTSEPMGHEDRTASTISFNSGTLTFTIAPVGASHTVWCAGKRYVKTTSETVTIPNTPGLYYISYDATGALQYELTFFTWHEDTPTAYVYWNGSSYLLFDERHGITLDWQTHEYLHRTRGAVLANGFGASNYTTTGDGTLDTDAQIDIANGTFFDEDLQVDIAHSATPTANTWEQILQGAAEIPIIYLSGATWAFDAATEFPLKQGASLPKYNLNTGGTWSTPDLGNNAFGVTWIVATNILNSPVIGILGQESYNNIGQAEAVEWSDLYLEGFPVVELRPLYKIIYDVKTSYTNTPKAAIKGVYDLRRYGSVAGETPALPVADHGSLTGLADDDHPQYLLADGSRSVSGTLTATAFSGPLTGNVTGDVTGNASTATKLATSRTISLTGDVTGSASFDGSANAAITATVADDSHNHVISNVDGLQTAIDAKQDAATALTTSTSFSGDVSGTYNAIVVADDSHNHIISNVDGLQTALDAKQAAATALTTSTSFGGDVSGTYNAIVVADDSHNHITSNIDGLEEYIEDIVAGSLTAGSQITVTYDDVANTITLAHADTSTQASVNNSNGTVIQDVTVDGNGHITALGSVDLDGRYYTETESDARFLRKNTSDTLTGSLTVTGDLTVDTSTLYVDATNNRVGVSTTSPLFSLHVSGDIFAATAAFIAGYVDANNVDHLWHDDSTNSWNFCSDTTYKAAGNSTLKAAALTTTGAVTSGGLTVDTNTLHVDATNNRVGIGTTSPQDPLHVQSGSSGFAGTYNARTVSIFESSNSAGTVISIMSPATGYSGIFFGDDGNEASGQFKYNHATDAFEFYASGATWMELTSSGTLDLKSDTTDVLNFTANSASDNRGISFNNRTALSADYNDGWLRLNQASEFTNGIYTPGNLRVDGVLRIDDTRGLTDVTGSYGTVQTTGAGLGGWEGYSIDGWAVFMADSSTGNFGLYDDVNNHWAVYCDFNGFVSLYYDNSAKLTTTATGVTVTGTLTADAKSFDIPHPTKDGHRLQYGSVEAPEHSVQVRGRCTDSVIQLPDYWVGLVDPDSITVQLTPVGRPQTLYVESWDATQVQVGGDENKDFFYTVSAERIDIEKLVVEYVESE